jgi:pSer/pThr/pTyr-binding forkhead associated (FHA) protein
MRIVVKQKDGPAREFQFSEGPISIGRAVNNMILLPDRAVSKQHAIISVSNNGKWIIEDMDSANKTYLNNEAIHKAEIKHGDCLRITSFSIEIDLEEKPEIDEATQLEDTLNLEASLSIPIHETVVRKPDAGHAPAMRLPAKRLNDFLQATEAICEANNLEELLLTLLNITQKQFSAFHTWCALREQPSGPMTYHAGKRRDGQVVELSDIKLSEKINQAVERGQSLVMPRVAADVEERARIRSAIIATIRRTAGCYGVLYVDNAMVHEHYSLSDLDYLMLLAMHTAAVLKRLINS